MNQNKNLMKILIVIMSLVINSFALQVLYNIESPNGEPAVSSGQSVTISGWYLSDPAIFDNHVYFYLDGNRQSDIIANQYRPDVKNSYPQYNNENAGFSYSINTSGMKAGRHTIEIRPSKIDAWQTRYFTVISSTETPSLSFSSGPSVRNIGQNSITIDWSTTINSTGTIDYWVDGYDHEFQAVNSSSTSHSVTLNNLSSGTTYKYQISAYTNNNSIYSNIATFTTDTPKKPTAPSFISGPTIRNVGQNSITIDWRSDIISTGLIDYWVEGYSHEYKEFNTLAELHSHTLINLSSGTTYKYQITLIGNGLTNYSTIGTFTTNKPSEPIPPSITSGPTVKNIGSNSVTIEWGSSVTTTGIIDYWVEGYSHEYVQSSNPSKTHISVINNLEPATKYLYQISLSANNLTSYSTISNFTTQSAPPYVETIDATLITCNSLTLNGSVEKNNGLELTEYGFYWGTSSGAISKKIIAGKDGLFKGKYMYNLTGLVSGSTIHFQAYAKNSAGETRGAAKSTVLKTLIKRGCLDNPKENNPISDPSVNVEGWYLDPKTVSKITITVDGKTMGNATYGYQREDVYKVFPDYNNHNAGFKFSLNTSGLFNGNHVIRVTETGNDGIQSLVAERTFFIANGTSSYYLNGNEYSIIDIYLSWDEAKQYCENKGGHLVTITNQQEQTFITNVLKNGTRKYYWIGLYQKSGSSEPSGNWTWVTEEILTEKSFTSWRPGQPDNVMNSDVGAIIKDIDFDNQSSPGLWHDDTKTGITKEMYGFILERDLLVEPEPGKYYLTDLVLRNKGKYSWDPASSTATVTVNKTIQKYHITDGAISTKPDIKILGNKIVLSLEAFDREFFSVLPDEAYLSEIANSSNCSWNENEKAATVTLNNIEKQYLISNCKIVNNKIVVKKNDFEYDFNFGLLEGESYLRKLVTAYQNVSLFYNEDDKTARVTYENRSIEYKIGSTNVKLVNDHIVVSSDALEYLVKKQNPTVEIVQNLTSKTSITVKAVFPLDGMYGNRIEAYDVIKGEWLRVQPDNYLTHGYYKIENLTPGGNVRIYHTWHDGVSWHSQSISTATLPNDPFISTRAIGEKTISVTVQYPLTGNNGNSLILYNNGQIVKDISNSKNTKDNRYEISNLIPGTRYEARMTCYYDGILQTKSAFVIVGEKEIYYNKLTGSRVEIFKGEPVGLDLVRGNTLVTMYSARDGHPFEFGASYMVTAKTVNWLCANDYITMYDKTGGNQKVIASDIASKRNTSGLFTRFDMVVMSKNDKFVEIFADQINSLVNNGYSFTNVQYSLFDIKPRTYNPIVKKAQILFNTVNSKRLNDLFDLGNDGTKGIWVEGGMTYKAIKKFQIEHDLPATGKLTPLTFAVLEFIAAQNANVSVDKNIEEEIKTQQNTYNNDDSQEKPIPNQHSFVNNPWLTDYRHIDARKYGRYLLDDVINHCVAFGYGDPTYLPVYKTNAEGEIKAYNFKYSLGDFIFATGCMVEAIATTYTGGPVITALDKIILAGKIGAVAVGDYYGPPDCKTLSDITSVLDNKIEEMVSKTRGASIAFAQYNYLYNSDYRYLVSPKILFFNEVSFYKKKIKKLIKEVETMTFSVYDNTEDNRVFKNAVIDYLDKIDRMNNEDLDRQRDNLSSDLREIEEKMNSLDIEEIIEINNCLSKL